MKVYTYRTFKAKVCKDFGGNNYIVKLCQTESVKVDSSKIVRTQSARFPSLHSKSKRTDPISSGRSPITIGLNGEIITSLFHIFGKR